MINRLIVSSLVSSLIYLFSSYIKLLHEPHTVGYGGPCPHGTFNLAEITFPVFLLKIYIYGPVDQGYNK